MTAYGTSRTGLSNGFGGDRARTASRVAMLLAASLLSSAAAASPAASSSISGPRAAIAAANALPPGSIDELKAVQIGGIPQWISVRGTNPDNPIILFLHGGPGSPMMPESWTFQRPWEDFFTVVQWDQRGSGKTFSATNRRTDEKLTLDLMTKDANELIDYLRKTYHKKKIIVMGNSWGSALGLTAALRRPDQIAAYVGIGQVVNMRRNEAEGYRLTLEEARRQNDTAAVSALQALAPYPEKDGTIPIAKTVQERRWDVALHGMIHALPVDDEAQRRSVSPYYDDHDLESAELGQVYSAVSLWPDVSNVSFDNVKNFPFPIVIFAGKHDRTTPTPVARAFFDRIKAPYKKFFLVENAAHYVVNEAPGEVLVDLVRDVLPLAQNTNSTDREKALQ